MTRMTEDKRRKKENYASTVERQREREKERERDSREKPTQQIHWKRYVARGVFVVDVVLLV